MEIETVHLFVLDGFADWETGYATTGINQPDYQRRPGRYVVRTVGPSRSAVRTMGGVTIVPDMALAELTPEMSALLILPGSPAWDAGEHDAVVAKARVFLAAGVPVAAICGATGALARHGVLDACRHTSNDREYLAAQPGYAGSAHYVDAPAVRDGDVITAGATSPVEFAREIFDRLDVYEPAVLHAWYRLYSTGDVSAFHALGNAPDPS